MNMTDPNEIVTENLGNMGKYVDGLNAFYWVLKTNRRVFNIS